MAVVRDFPHLDDTQFPSASTINTYKYHQEFDYSRYSTTNSTAHLMRVPWRGDYADVAHFGDESKRDEWLEARFADSVELPSMFRLYNSGDLKIEVPIDMAIKYNYIVIDYAEAAGDGDPVKGESADGIRRICYFIDDVQQESVNTTRLLLSCDFWQTYIYRAGIDYVELLRGHAPMSISNVREYLNNPLENSRYLLATDESFGELQNQASEEHIVLNDEDIKFCIASTGDLSKEWGAECVQTPLYSTQTLTDTRIYYTDITNWEGFVNACESQAPQFLQTVRAVFLVPGRFLKSAGAVTFCGHTLQIPQARTNAQVGKFDITADKFGYPSDYAKIAKLYTYPYSEIVIDDLEGGRIEVKVEETAGSLPIQTVFDFMAPSLFVEARVLGLGGSGTASLDFKTSVDNEYTIGGRDYDFSTRWDIPTFAVQFSANADWAVNSKIGADCSRANAYASADVSRTNANASAQTGLDNANASAATAQTNANASAGTAQTNANASASTAQLNANASANAGYNSTAASADTTLSNTKRANQNALDKVAVNNAASTVVCNRNIAASLKDTNYGNELNQALQAWNAGLSRDTQAASASAATQTAALSAASAQVNNAIGNVANVNSAAISGFAEHGVAGAIAGGVGAGVSAFASGAQTAVSGVTSLVNTAISNNLEATKVELQIENSQQCVDASNTNATQRADIVTTCESQNNSTASDLNVNITTLDVNTSNRNTSENVTTTKSNAARSRDTAVSNAANSYGTSTANASRSYETSVSNAANSYATSTENARRSYDTSVANAQRSYDLSIANADRSYEATEAQSRIHAHPEFGSVGGDAALAVKPMALRASVITQSEHALRAAAEQFLRYGYNLGMQWKIEDFTLMPYFTFWQCGQVQAHGDIYNGALAVIKSVLQAGVNVWGDPDKIGAVSIYENQEG